MHRSNFHNAFVCLLVASISALLGCGDSGDGDAIVQGVVTIDGQLVDSGSVVFHSQDEAPAAYGTIRSDGTYALRVGRGNVNNINASKIKSGKYVATVQVRGPSVPDEEFPGAPPKAGPLLIAEKYTSKATSGLEHTIKAGRNVVNLELESPSEEELAARAEAAEAKAAEAEENADSDATAPAEESTESEPQETETSEESPVEAEETDDQEAAEESES